MRASLLIPLLAAACGPGLLEPEFVDRLARFSGCGDVIFFAVDAEDEVMVTFSAEGLVAQARQAGTETTSAITFPSEDVELKVEQGSRISDATCDDVIENAGPRVRRSWTATSGTATVRIRPSDDATGARGDLLLEDVVLTSGGHSVPLARLEWSDVSVGWFAG